MSFIHQLATFVNPPTVALLVGSEDQGSRYAGGPASKNELSRNAWSMDAVVEIEKQ